MAIPSEVVMFRLNDQFIEIDGLVDPTTGTAINGATVTATLVDESGAQVPSLTNVALTYIAGSAGNYRGLVEQTFNPSLGSGYTLTIKASAPGQGPDNTVDLYLEIPARVAPRTS